MTKMYGEKIDKFWSQNQVRKFKKKIKISIEAPKDPTFMIPSPPKTAIGALKQKKNLGQLTTLEDALCKIQINGCH